MAGSLRRTLTTPSKSSPGARSQSSVKKNGSLLNFFQKADGPPKSSSRQARITQFTAQGERPNNGRFVAPRPRLVKREDSSASGGAEGLFLEDRRGVRVGTNGNAEVVGAEGGARSRSRTPDDILGDDLGDLREGEGKEDGEERYNENGGAVKRRKVDSPTPQNPDAAQKEKKNAVKSKKVSGPFIDESDSEDELDAFKDFREAQIQESPSVTAIDTKETHIPAEDERTANDRVATADVPPLVREATSHILEDEYANFDDLEEDEFQGEEFFLGPEELKREETSGCDANDIPTPSEDVADEIPTCPVCQGSLEDLGENDISTHVNDCLDGKPSTILPKISENQLARVELSAVAKPAQRDPFSSKTTRDTSAFSKIMAGNAEDTAWAEAAASDVASRGKQAYQRTCPFYKIITGFSISVDAFRYGAVEGCNAYFLSHFHSDHYIGLSKSWRHGPIYCSRATANLVREQLKVDSKWIVDLEFEKPTEVPDTGGVRVTMIEANHCPGSAIFLFEKAIASGSSTRIQRVLHCGDFRASAQHVQHALLRPDIVDPRTGQTRQQKIDVCYLDTTYLSPKYAFPRQTDVINACAELCVRLDQGQDDGLRQMFWQTGNRNSSNNDNKSKNPISQLLTSINTKPLKPPAPSPKPQGRLLVVIGTYSIGKERICLAIARALKSKIYATPAKHRVCACLEDSDLSSLLTTNPLEAQVHMQTLFEIRSETLSEYLDSLKPHFTRVVGFRPTGWTYRPPAGRTLENPPVSTVLHSPHWKTPFSVGDLTPQRGSTRESACFGVPYSEHSSFRELTMFCCALRIGRIIPTVNVGSQKSRERMKAWFERWEAEKRKSGLFRVQEDEW